MCVNSGISASGAIESDISVIPYISTEKPISMFPVFFVFCFLPTIIIMIPTRAKTGEKFSGFIIFSKNTSESIPARLSIHAVRVVPILEPISMHMVCPNSSIPEFTRPTSITVRADDDCMAIVIAAPKHIARNLFEVTFLRVRSSFPFAIFSSPPDITFIP